MMSSVKHNNTQQIPQPDWKFEVERHWKAVCRKLLDYFHSHKQQFSISKMAGIVGASSFVLWLISGIYSVAQGNRGVVTRFEAYSETTLPGPNWHIPMPIENVTLINVEQQRFIEVGYRGNSQSNKPELIAPEALMLTKDENIINVRLAVQYQIVDEWETIARPEPEVDIEKASISEISLDDGDIKKQVAPLLEVN
jgi:membrane protease subunit HflK